VNAAELKPFALLQDLSDEEAELLAEELESRELAPGRALFEQGADADGMFLVLEGRLTLASREQGELGGVGRGELLGALSLVAPGRREVSAVAAEPCRVAWLEHGAFRRLMDDAPRAACRILEALLRETAGQLREALPALGQALPSAPNDGPE